MDMMRYAFNIVIFDTMQCIVPSLLLYFNILRHVLQENHCRPTLYLLNKTLVMLFTQAHYYV